RPNKPYVAPAKYFGLYPFDRVHLPKEPPEHLRDVPRPALASTTPWPHFGVTLDQARECKQAYYAAISFVDAQIGKLLDTMDRLKLWDTTIVIFWSDHGYHLGEHGLWMKQSLFEESARVPLIIVAPGAKGAGKSCGRMAELLDLFPTLVDLCGLPARTQLEGKSLRPLLDDPTKEGVKPAAFT